MIDQKYLSQFDVGEIIDCLPENLPLYKDSGLWQVRSDDMEDIICAQKANQPFREFIEGYALLLLSKKGQKKEDLELELGWLELKHSGLGQPFKLNSPDGE